MSLSSRRRPSRSAPRDRSVASTLSMHGCPCLEFARHALFAGLRPRRVCRVHALPRSCPRGSRSCARLTLGLPSVESVRVHRLHRRVASPIGPRGSVPRARGSHAAVRLPGCASRAFTVAVPCAANGPLRAPRLPEDLEARSSNSLPFVERVAVRSASRKVALAIRVSRTANARAVFLPRDALAARVKPSSPVAHRRSHLETAELRSYPRSPRSVCSVARAFAGEAQSPELPLKPAVARSLQPPQQTVTRLLRPTAPKQSPARGRSTDARSCPRTSARRCAQWPQAPSPTRAVAHSHRQPCPRCPRAPVASLHGCPRTPALRCAQFPARPVSVSLLAHRPVARVVSFVFAPVSFRERGSLRFRSATFIRSPIVAQSHPQVLKELKRMPDRFPAPG